MDTMHCDCSRLKEGTINCVLKRGTYYDKLQHDGFCRLQDRNGRTSYGIAKVLECLVVRFHDIEPVYLLTIEKMVRMERFELSRVSPFMVQWRTKDNLLKDMLLEHHNFHDHEIVTIIFFTIHHKYTERENTDGKTDSSD